MFYLRLNKLRIYSNGSLLGMSEVQLMSFVTLGEADFPMINDFFHCTDVIQKRELVSQAVSRVVSSRVMPEIQRVKDNQIIFFGDTGYNVFVTDAIPESVNWMLLVLKSNREMIDNTALLSQLLTENNLNTFVNSISLLASATSPVTAAVSTLTTLVAQSVLKFCASTNDRQLGLLLTSFTRQEHYPFGKRDARDAPDATGNMKVDYTIFGF